MFYVDAINYIFSTILFGVALTWILLIKSMWITFRDSPYLDKFESKSHSHPMVSVILPARNEEKFIERCIRSLVEQDYNNYEIIVIDDRSDDKTGEIIKRLAKENSKIVHVLADPKPKGWMGKNWACMEGFRIAKGDLLLFTDADTVHTTKIISLAVNHLLGEYLDAITVIPRMLCLDRWTRITLPVLSTFLHTRFSALRVNDTSKKTGYFFGSFFVIKRQVYVSAGTHEGVKSEIVEDGALGKKVKEFGFKLKMVRGEHLIEAVWARDWSTLWHGLKRLMIPLYLQNRGIAIGIFFAVLFLLFMPFPLLVYASIFSQMAGSYTILFASSILASGLLYVACIIDADKGLSLKIRYAIFVPIGAAIIIGGFSIGIIHAKKDDAVRWRGRTYSMVDTIQNSISL